MTSNWQEVPEAGTGVAIRFLVWVARVLGRTVLHVLLAPIAAYFMAVRVADRRASRDYLTRVLGRAPRLSEIFRHFYTFARVIADRVYFISGNTSGIDVRLYGAEPLQELVDRGKGGIVLSAHLGSFEAARVLGAEVSGVVLRMVLDKRINQNLVTGLESVNPEFSAAIIDLNQPPAALALDISGALKKGEWLGFLSDRTTADGRTETVDFLGSPARFAIGPLLIAAVFKVPLVSVFPLYKDGGYEVYCETLSRAVDVPRAQRSEALRGYLGEFVKQLEKYVRMEPFNWFNFFDYWENR